MNTDSEEPFSKNIDQISQNRRTLTNIIMLTRLIIDIIGIITKVEKYDSKVHSIKLHIRDETTTKSTSMLMTGSLVSAIPQI